MIEHPSAVFHRLETEVEQAGGQRAWAKARGFSPSFINDVMRGRREITDRLAAALGFRRVTLWKDLRDKARSRGDHE
jgi:hypothetical protein